VERIIKEFCPRYAPGGVPLYVGDTDEKWAFYNKKALEALEVTIEVHGRMPDMVNHYTALREVAAGAAGPHSPGDGCHLSVYKSRTDKGKGP
jgi:hypothetical protein